MCVPDFLSLSRSKICLQIPLSPLMWWSGPDSEIVLSITVRQALPQFRSKYHQHHGRHPIRDEKFGFFSFLSPCVSTPTSMQRLELSPRNCHVKHGTQMAAPLGPPPSAPSPPVRYKYRSPYLPPPIKYIPPTSICLPSNNSL